MKQKRQRCDGSVTGIWPTKYRARFWSRRTVPYQVAAIQFFVGIFKSPRNLASALGVLVVAVGIGTLVGALSAFPPYWPVFALAALVIVIAGAASAVLSYPHRSQIYDRYRPGTESQIAVADGILMLSLNSHQLRLPVAGVTKVWRFGRLSAIEFVDTKSVVIPTDLVPHWVVPGEGLEINARWGNPSP